MVVATRARPAVVCVLGVLLTGACGSDESLPPEEPPEAPPATSEPELPPNPTEPPGPPPPDDPEPSPAAAEAPRACTDRYPKPVGFAPRTQEEANALDGLIACLSSDGTATMIANRSNYVWIMPDRSLAWSPEDTAAQSIEVQMFRDTVERTTGGLALQPGAWVALGVPPGEIYITVTEEAQSAWEAVVLIKFAVEEGRTGALSSDISPSGRSSLKAAGVECGVAAVGAAQAYKEISDPKTRFEAWLSGLGVAGGAATCAGAVNEWRKARTPPDTTPNATQADELLDLARRPAFASSAQETLHTAAAVSDTIPDLWRILSRIP